MKNPRIASLIFLVALLPLSIVRADDPLASGKAALDRGDFLAAIPLLREAVKKDKKNPQAYILLGTALLKADSLDQAVASLVQARELDSSNAQVYDLLGDVYMKQNIPPAAIDQYRISVGFDSTKPQVYLKLAEACRKGRIYTEAVKAYFKVIYLDSMNTTALSQLGRLLNRAKHYADAAPILERLVRIRPDSIEVLALYGKALYEIHDYQKFIPVGEKIDSVDPSQADNQTMLADAYNATGNDSAALEKFKGLKPDSMSAGTLIKMAKTLKRLQRYEEGVDAYVRAYKKDSTKCEIPYDLGTLYMRVKKYGDAVEMFEKKIACDTSAGYRFASHLNSGMCLMQIKKFDEAKDHILKAIELRPDNVQAWQTLAEDYAQIGNTAEEIKAFQKVIDLALAANENNGDANKYNSSLEESYRIIGVQYLLEKKFAQAAEYLKKAAQLQSKTNPNYCHTLLWIAQAYHNSNNKEDAKRYYCKVLELCPKGKEAEDAQNGLNLLGMTCQ